jgi:hypothetical protein
VISVVGRAVYLNHAAAFLDPPPAGEHNNDKRVAGKQRHGSSSGFPVNGTRRCPRLDPPRALRALAVDENGQRRAGLSACSESSNHRPSGGRVQSLL